MKLKGAEVAVSGMHLQTMKVSFSRILMGHDFSEPSQRALQTAIAIAELFAAKITVAHALSLFLPSMASPGVVSEATDVLVANAEKKIDEAIASVSHEGLTFKKAIEFGSAVDLLAKCANDTQADLIVLGSHASMGAARIMLGSVAESVLRHVTCPVLITGPKCHKSSHPFRSILFATDLDSTGLRPAQYAVSMAEQFQSRLTLLHVFEKKPSVESGIREDLEQGCLRELELLLPPDAELWCRPDVESAYGRPSEEILAVANNKRASLIVIGTGKNRPLSDHSPWGTIGQILQQASCPVLAIPSGFTIH